MNPSTARPPTLHDVARRAGVHPATVSRALNHPDMVAPATRDAVLAAVATVGFVPNRSARQLVSGRADAIGIVVPDVTNPYFAAIVRAIQGGARGDGRAVLIADTDASADEERRALATLSRQVDGLVVVTPITDLATATVPVVQVNRRSRGTVGVSVDQSAIVHAAVGHLVDLGHHHVAVVRGPAAYWSAGVRDRAVERLAGRLLEGPRLEDRLLDDRPDGGVRVELVGPVPATFEGGRTAFAEVERSGATGVVAFNDLQAAGVLVAAQEAGRSVPGSLSVVGSDGLALATMTSPPLTTVAAPLDDVGRTALTRLDDLLTGQTAPHHTTLEPRLVTRATTAPPAAPRRDTRHRRGRTHHVQHI